MKDVSLDTSPEICSNCGASFGVLKPLKGRHWLCKACENKKLAGANIKNEPKPVAPKKKAAKPKSTAQE